MKVLIDPVEISRITQGQDNYLSAITDAVKDGYHFTLASFEKAKVING